MSIVRISALRNTLYAPTADGNLVMDAYNRRRRVGRLEALLEPQIPRADGALRHYLIAALNNAAQGLAPDRPVVVMVHGFLFDPKQAVGGAPEETDNPHGRIYHFVDGDEREEQRHHTASWPLGLGFDPADATGASGLAVAFGWLSQPGFASSLIDHFQNFYARAYGYAGEAAWCLVNVIRILQQILPGRPIDIVCHSLGSRLVVRALALAAKHNDKTLLEGLGHVVILGGAEYVVEAQLMHRRLDDLGLARRAAIYNIVSRENDVLDKLGENFGPRTFGNSQVIGHNGLSTQRRSDHWIDLQIDGGALQDWMAGRGFQISGDRPGNVWDHWYYFTHRGNMALYADIIRNREAWGIAGLRAQNVPDGISRSWWGFGD